MHIAINAHLLSGSHSYRSAGVHQYIYHLLDHLPEAGCQVTALVGPQSVLPNATLQTQRSRWPTHRPLARIAWEQCAQPAALRRLRADLAHGPVFVAPLGAPCPSIVTIHDLSFVRFPRLFRPANRLYLGILTRLSAKRAHRIIAVSAHAADEAAQLLQVQRHRIDVVYHGVDPVYRPLQAEEVERFRAATRLPERFVLFLGTLEPRKNLLRLVEAFARLREPDLKLVLAGGRGWYDEEIYTRVETLGLKETIIFPGYVPGEDLPLWYNAAAVFAFPSIYEGFGMPVLEAQACGTPALTSNCTALPEAAGDGALLVDPYRVDAIAAGLERLLRDDALRGELRQRGLAHAARFTWQQTAADTVAVYRRALDRSVSA